MQHFFLIAGGVIFSLHGYLFWKLRQGFGGGWWQLPVLLFFAFIIVLFALRRSVVNAYGLPPWVLQAGYVWLGVLSLSVLVFLCFDLARLAAWLLKLCSGPDLRAWLAPGRLIWPSLALCLAVSLYSLYEARTPRVINFTIETEKLPPGVERVRVVGLSDVHLSENIREKELEKVVRLAREQAPDILAVVGDLVDTNMRGRDAEAALLRSIPARTGKYAVLGNHEYYRGLENSRGFIRKSGLELLENRAVNDKAGIIVVGVDDPAVPRTAGTPGTLQILRRQKQGRFTLLLAHRPMVEAASVGLFDLQLSGHTHGGQIWPFTYLANKLNGDASQGLNVYESARGRSLMILSNGTGYWGPPMRFLAPPQVVVVDIVRKAQGATALPYQ